MKRNDDFLREPRRQSAVAIILILLKFIRGVIRSLWPFLLVYLFRPQEKGDDNSFLIGFIIISAISVIGSIISYFRFYFFIEEEDLVIRKGLLRRTRLNVPFDRIQSVNFQENPVHRFFNVVSLEIDTAGSRGSEFQIDALSREDAHQIRDYLLAKKRAALPEEEEKEVEETLLMHLKPLDLLKIGVSENHIRTTFIILGFFLGVLSNIEEAMGWNVDELYEQFVGIDIHSFLGAMLLFVPILILVSFILTLVRTVLRYFDLKLWRSERAFKLVAGLLNRRELSLPHRKIQLISRTTNPLKKLFGFHALRLFQAASDEVGRKESVQIPGVYPEQWQVVLDSYIRPAFQKGREKCRISRLAIGRYTLFFGVVPSLVLTAIQLILGQWLGLLFLAWIPLAYYLVRIYYRKRYLEVNEEIILSHSGIIADVEKWLMMHKVQAVRIRQTPYQRRRSVANVYLYTASGAMSVPYLPLEDALALHDFVMYKVESSHHPWM